MTRVTVQGIAVLGPGLPGWAASRPILTGEAPWVPSDVTLPSPTILSATERRRTGPVTRLALAVATEAVAASFLAPRDLRIVFGSGNGDGRTVAAILEAVTTPGGFVSPTQFHNSVHNAAAGYWSIGVGSQQPATCVAAEDWTFPAALMQAVTECWLQREPVLLVVYDDVMPPPLDVLRPLGSIFGVALVLAPDGAGPALTVQWDPDPPAETPEHPLTRTNPAARSLPLLTALAHGRADDIPLAYLDGALRVTLAP